MDRVGTLTVSLSEERKAKKRQFRTLTLFLVGSVAVLMLLRFYLMLYFPGTPETHVLFTWVSRNWDWFSRLTWILKFPVDTASAFLVQAFHLNLKTVYPEMPSAMLMKLLLNRPGVDYLAKFPGQVEWNALLAVPFWGMLLVLMYECAWYLSNFRDRHLPRPARKQAKAVAPAPQPAPSRQPGRKLFGGNEEAAGPTSSASGSMDSKTRERLSAYRNTPVSDIPLKVPPRSPASYRPASEEEKLQFKRQQGDMMVRGMIQDLRQENQVLRDQQQHLRSTFSQYFSPNVLQYLEENKGVFQSVQNEKRNVSIMFCDIRGFSRYSQSASSDEVVSFLSEYFEIASYVILHRYDGVISKLMGDGLMAYWGFPIPQEDHAYIATRAALDILREVQLRNETTRHAVPLNIGIGIATGDAIVGNIGSMDFKDFTMVGTPVNLAARLDEINKQLQTSVLISGNTYAGLKGRIACRDFGDMQVRGLQGTEHIFSPLPD